MKESVRKLVERLRGRRSSNSPPPEPPQTDSLPHFSTELGKSGLTVFDDRALRFRNLTLANGTSETIDDPGALQGAFKIRVAKREGFRREASTLVDRRYTDRGYQTKAAEPDPHLFTFVAYDEGELVGTSASASIPRGVVGRRAVQGRARRPAPGRVQAVRVHAPRGGRGNVSKTVLAGLFHTAYLYAAKCTPARSS